MSTDDHDVPLYVPFVDYQPSGPDMPAVYILVGCLTISACVIVGLCIYCLTQYGRQRYAQHRYQTESSMGVAATALPLSTHQRVPTIKISDASSQDISTISNGRSQQQQPSMDDQPNNNKNRKVSSPTTTTDDSAVHQPLILTTSITSIGWWQRLFVHHPRLHRPLSINNHQPNNGHYYFAVNSDTIGGADDGFGYLDEDHEVDNRSVLHYELGSYEKTSTSSFRGTVTFSLRYDFVHRVLMLHVIRADQLPAENRSGSMDAYIKMYLLPERRTHCKTKISKRTLNPEFNEMFSFDVAFSALPNRMLQLTVYDFDRFARHDLIGNIIMRDLFEKSDLHNWTEYTMQIVGSDENDYGDLLLYLNYSIADQRLTVTVSKAYNLRPMDITGASVRFSVEYRLFSDPYVRVEHIYQRRRLKMRKTSIKRANLNPVYHESLEFDIGIDQIDESSLLVQVMDWDRIGRDDLLGCCIIGRDSPTKEGRDQWIECFASITSTDRQHLIPQQQNRNKQSSAIGKWHSILADTPDAYKDLPKAKK